MTLTAILMIMVGSLAAQAFWQRSLNSGYNEGLAVTDNGYVYAVKNSRTVDRTTADGALNTWTQLSGYPAPIDGYNQITAIGNDIMLTNSGGILGGGRGLYLSTDDGATWFQRNNGLGADTNVFRTFKLANNALLTVWAENTSEYKFYHSTDMGANWVYKQTFTGNFQYDICTVSATEAYYVSNSKLYKSTDNGQNWVVVNPSIPYAIQRIVSMQSGDLLSSNAQHILKSTDQGVTWDTLVTTGLVNYYNNGGPMYESANDTVYVISENVNGIYFSADQGTTWQPTGTGITFGTQVFGGDNFVLSKRGYLFVAPSNDGIYRSINRVSANVVTTAAEPSLLDNPVTAYPNPSHGEITIAGMDETTSSLSIYDLSGRLLSCNAVLIGGEWHVTGLGVGCYVYRLISKSGKLIKTSKIIVE